MISQMGRRSRNPCWNPSHHPFNIDRGALRARFIRRTKLGDRTRPRAAFPHVLISFHQMEQCPDRLREQ